MLHKFVLNVFVTLCVVFKVNIMVCRLVVGCCKRHLIKTFCYGYLPFIKAK